MWHVWSCWMIDTTTKFWIYTVVLFLRVRVKQSRRKSKYQQPESGAEVMSTAFAVGAFVVGTCWAGAATKQFPLLALLNTPQWMNLPTMHHIQNNNAFNGQSAADVFWYGGNTSIFECAFKRKAQWRIFVFSLEILQEVGEGQSWDDGYVGLWGTENWINLVEDSWFYHYLCNQDTSLIRRARCSPPSVRNREVLLCSVKSSVQDYVIAMDANVAIHLL